MLFAGIVAMEALSRTVTILALWLSDRGTRLPVTDTLSRVYTVSAWGIRFCAEDGEEKTTAIIKQIYNVFRLFIV